MREAQGGLDVLGLGALITASQQDDQLLPPPLEIHPVTGAIVDSQFRHTFPDWLDIARVSGSKALDPGLNARSGLDVAQAVEPLSKYVGLRISIIGYSSQVATYCQ